MVACAFRENNAKINKRMHSIKSVNKYRDVPTISIIKISLSAEFEYTKSNGGQGTKNVEYSEHHS